MNNMLEKPILTAGKDTPIVFCWFVEDNGAGNKGYAFMDARVGRPLTPGERLFSTIEEVREALKKQESKTFVLMPQHPDWVPKGWRVRNLSSNEVDQLGFSNGSVLEK
jgi:hypothetical protein